MDEDFRINQSVHGKRCFRETTKQDHAKQSKRNSTRCRRHAECSRDQVTEIDQKTDQADYSCSRERLQKLVVRAKCK